MKKSSIASAIILLFILAAAVSAAGLDQSQTTGGNPYYLYYGGHNWAKQEFVPTLEKITKVELKMGVDYNGVIDPCRGSSEEIDVEIWDSSQSAVAYARDVPICGITSGGWESFYLTQNKNLVPGKTYVIIVQYKGAALSGTKYFYWDRSSSNVISGNSITPEGTSSADFTYQTYGEQYCDHEYVCDGDSVFEIMTNCKKYYVETCAPGQCSNGQCSAPPAPSLSIKTFDLKDSSYNTQTSFNPGDDVVLYGSVESLNGVPGSYYVTFNILKDGQGIKSYSEQRTAPQLGLVDNPHWTYTIPADGTGDYSGKIFIDNCGGTCTAVKSFSSAVQCTDSDGDGYYADCEPLDCDDSSAMINPARQELGCDGIDNDCNALTLDNPDLDGDGVGICGGDCDDSDPLRTPGTQEVKCDGIDNDCDATTVDDVDADGDGTGVCGGDCDDSDPLRLPGNDEVACDGIDNDCDASTPDSQDSDGDGYSTCDDDCDDSSRFVFPGNEETLCDGMDNDCDPATPDGPDADGDGYSACGGDCDDSNPLMHPFAEEICGNNIDEDCDFLDAVCECAADLANCDGLPSNGCETNITSDSDNCGTCGNACGPGEQCSYGSCVNETLPSADYIIMTPEVFEQFADESIKEHRVNEFVLNDMSESDAEKVLQSMVDQLQSCPHTAEDLQKVADFYADRTDIPANQNFTDDLDACLSTIQYSAKAVDFIAHKLMRPPVYTTQIPVDTSQGIPIVLEREYIIFDEQVDAVTKVSRKASKYSQQIDDLIENFGDDIVGRAGGAVQLGGILLSISTGLDMYNGSVMHALMYAGEKQLEMYDFACQVVDYGVEYNPLFAASKTIIMTVNPDYEPVKFSEVFRSITGPLVEDAHAGAEAIDMCIARNEVVECTARNINLFTVLAYAHPYIQEFDFTSEPGGEAVAEYTLINGHRLAPSWTKSRLDIVTNKSSYTLVGSDYLLQGVLGISATNSLSMPLAADEGVTNATLTTFTGCTTEDISSCQWWVDTRTKGFSLPEYPSTKMTIAKTVWHKGEVLRIYTQNNYSSTNPDNSLLHTAELRSVPSFREYQNITQVPCTDAEACFIIEIDTSKEFLGTHSLTYTVTNNWGLSATATAELEIVQKGAKDNTNETKPNNGNGGGGGGGGGKGHNKAAVITTAASDPVPAENPAMQYVLPLGSVSSASSEAESLPETVEAGTAGASAELESDLPEPDAAVQAAASALSAESGMTRVQLEDEAWWEAFLEMLRELFGAEEDDGIIRSVSVRRTS